MYILCSFGSKLLNSIAILEPRENHRASPSGRSNESDIRADPAAWGFSHRALVAELGDWPGFEYIGLRLKCA